MKLDIMPRHILFACAIAALIGSQWLNDVSARPGVHTTERPAFRDMSKPVVAEPPQLLPAEQQEREFARLRADVNRLDEQRRQMETRISQLDQKLDAAVGRVGDLERGLNEARAQAKAPPKVEPSRPAQTPSPETARIAAAERARWTEMTKRIFGAPLWKDSPCDLPAFQGQRCENVRLDPPTSVSFSLSYANGERMDIGVSLTSWNLAIHYRNGRTRVFSDGPLDYLQTEMRNASLRILTRYGFTREMLRQCENETGLRFGTIGLEYRCVRARPWEFSVQANPAERNSCHAHPLCSSGTGLDQTSRPGAGSPNRAYARP
jgi:hypothetical protein